MRRIVLKRFLVLALLASVVALLAACAGMERAPKHRSPGPLYYPTELVEADRALDAARAAGKDKECPADFNEVNALVDKTYEVYISCRTNEAIKMAQDATAKAKALCPPKPATKQVTKPEAKPAPMPEVKPEPKPEVKPTPKPAKVIDKMTLRVLFDFDKAILSAADIKELQRAVAFVKKYSGAKIRLDGYTDSIGTDAYNLRLSERRAVAVKEYLIKEAGVDKEKITAVGHGKSDPVASNKTAEGRAKNRRTEIAILSD